MGVIIDPKLTKWKIRGPENPDRILNDFKKKIKKNKKKLAGRREFFYFHFHFSFFASIFTSIFTSKKNGSENKKKLTPAGDL